MTTVNTTNNDELIHALEMIGLDSDEALVYLSCLELGSSAAWGIYLKSGIKRPTCYVILDKLVAKGIAGRSNDGRRTIFSVASPRELITLFEQKKGVFAQKMSELEAMANKSPDKPKIRTFEGVEGIKQAYNLTLNLQPGEDILFYSTNDSERTHPEYFESYIKLRVDKGIKARGIFSNTPENIASVTPRDKAENRQSRFLPKKEYSPSIDASVFGDSVIYMAYGEREPFATVIESKALARDEKQRFELLWKLAVKQ